MPTPRSSACRFGTNGVTFDTQHMPIQWKAPILVCLNRQGLPTVLNRERKEGRSSMTANSRVNAFKNAGNAPPDQGNGSQPTALSLMVLMGNTILREEQAPSVIAACSSSIQGSCIRDIRDYNPAQSLFMDLWSVNVSSISEPASKMLQIHPKQC